MKSIHKYIILVLLSLAFGLHSCYDKVNDWPIEDIENRLFLPIIFEPSTLKPTSIEIKYTKVADASKYIFQFSKNNFESIEKEFVILADTLTPFSESQTNPLKTEYRTMFEGLDGTSIYLVRMYSENTDATLKSKYSMFEFTTPAEQLFKGYSTSSDVIFVNWVAESNVTHIVLKQGDTEIEKRTLSAGEKSSGKAQFTGLTMGLGYTVTILRDDILRGTLQLKTAGIANSTIYKVLPTDNCFTINAALANLIVGGAKDITVEFEPGKTYNLPYDDGNGVIESTIIIPAGTENISFIGSADANGNLPQVTNGNYTIEALANDVTFQNLELTANGGMLFNIDGKKFNDVLFENCVISNLNSIVRLYNGAIANSIKVNNCRVSKTGGWGMLNVGAGNTIASIIVSNSTLTEINTRFADVRVKTDIVFRNITAYNKSEKMSHLWLLDNNSAPTVKVENLIVSGANGGVLLNSTNGNYGNVNISYGGSYKTNDLKIDQRPLADISEVPLSAEELFVDPANGNFRIKPGTGFAGTGVAGDPRWFD